MLTKLTCACGQKFSSEGERARHQAYCDDFKRAQVREQLVVPLQNELDRLKKEADIITAGLAAAFDRFLDGNSSDAAYSIELAKRHLDHITDFLRDLADKTTAVSKNRYAITNRLRSELNDLVERLQSYDATVRKAQAYFRPRKA